MLQKCKDGLNSYKAPREAAVTLGKKTTSCLQAKHTHTKKKAIRPRVFVRELSVLSVLDFAGEAPKQDLCSPLQLARAVAIAGVKPQLRIGPNAARAPSPWTYWKQAKRTRAPVGAAGSEGVKDLLQLAILAGILAFDGQKCSATSCDRSTWPMSQLNWQTCD